jgi:hypothetical protein
MTVPFPPFAFHELNDAERRSFELRTMRESVPVLFFVRDLLKKNLHQLATSCEREVNDYE